MDINSTEESITTDALDPPEDGSMYSIKTSTQRAIQYTVLTLCVVTIIVNPITLVAMVKNRLVMMSSINVAITSICLSDLLIGLSVFAFFSTKMPLELAADDSGLVKARVVLGAFCVAAFFASNINSLLITVDRTVATVSPHEYKTTMTSKRTGIAVVSMWLTVIAFMVIACLAKVLMQGQISDIETPCQVLPAPVISYFTTPSMVTTMLTNIVLYGVIVRFLIKSGNKVGLQAQNKSLMEKRNFRITRMALTVIGVMLVGNLPIVILATVPVPAQPSAFYLLARNIAYDVAVCCAIVPTFINNVIYVGRLADFEKAIRDLLSCKREGSPVRRHCPNLASSNNATTTL